MINYIIIGIMLIILIAVFRQFRPANTQNITDNVYAIRCGIVNFYALRTDAGVVLFDTGINPILAKRGLRKVGIDSASVTHIFLTHTDYDHAGGLAAFPEAKCFISGEEEQMINGATARRGFIYNKRIFSYGTVNDGESIIAGGVEIKCFITPGHTPGSASYLIGNRFLASGDLLRVSRKGAILPFLRLMNMNHRQNVQSVDAMGTIVKSSEYILTGHTGLYKTSSTT